MQPVSSWPISRKKSRAVDSWRENNDNYNDSLDDSFQEYKKSMEEIGRESPHLSAGARHRMALERCAELDGERRRDYARRGGRQRGLSSSLLPGGVRGLVPRLTLGEEKQKQGAAPASKRRPRGLSLSTTAASTTTTRTRGFSDSDIDKRMNVYGKSRRSVKFVKMDGVRTVRMTMKDATVAGGSDDEDSLRNSLRDIEGLTLLDQSLDNVMRSSFASFGISDLSLNRRDWEEADEERPSSAKVEWRRRKIAPHNSDLLPDEIVAILSMYRLDEKETDGVNTEQSTRHGKLRAGRGGGLDDRGIDTSGSSFRDESYNSSFLTSVHSANFKGDFWAWRSVSSLDG